MTIATKKEKYKVYIQLERKGSTLKINDIVEVKSGSVFDLNDYIFKHDLEAYNIIKFNLTKIENEEN